MDFPNIDPVAFSIGPLSIKWYGLAYVVGLLLALWRASVLIKKYPEYKITKQQLEDFLTWAFVGIFIGGRLGFVFFYNAGYYVEHPVEILFVHRGGMSFHGGFLGVSIAAILFCKRSGIKLFNLTDILACVAPIGLFLGRLANYVNGELWGRPTDLPWGVIFPDPEARMTPRHPSQLYEAFFEGICLFVIANLLIRFSTTRQRAGTLTAIFLIGYFASRFLIEYTREPDAPLIGLLTRGQTYSIPMSLVGLAILVYSIRKKNSILP